MTKPRDVEAMLTGKCRFDRDRNRSEDHRRYILRLASGIVVQTHVSHNNKDIPEPILSKIARQMKVTRPIFNGLIVCTVTREEYYQILENL